MMENFTENLWKKVIITFLEWKKTENGYLINGRTLEDLRQESMMESDEGEEKPAATD